MLKNEKVKASFFLTGNFYRNPLFSSTIKKLKEAGHYLGAHSDRHLLYNDWSDRNKLLVTKDSFLTDLQRNYAEMKKHGITKVAAPYFLPPYEWYNDSIAAWSGAAGLQLINYTPGTLSHADYTVPGEKNYRSSATIIQSILQYEQNHSSGLNGFILLMHIGTDPKRDDKFYFQLPYLLTELKARGYELVDLKSLLRLR